MLDKCDCRGVIASAPGDHVDFVSRFFAPKCGIPEDPVTGSAHTTMAPYWSKVLGKTKMTAQQLSKRCLCAGSGRIMARLFVCCLLGALFAAQKGHAVIPVEPGELRELPTLYSLEIEQANDASAESYDQLAQRTASIGFAALQQELREILQNAEAVARKADAAENLARFYFVNRLYVEARATVAIIPEFTENAEMRWIAAWSDFQSERCLSTLEILVASTDASREQALRFVCLVKLGALKAAAKVDRVDINALSSDIQFEYAIAQLEICDRVPTLVPRRKTHRRNSFDERSGA